MVLPPLPGTAESVSSNLGAVLKDAHSAGLEFEARLAIALAAEERIEREHERGAGRQTAEEVAEIARKFAEEAAKVARKSQRVPPLSRPLPTVPSGGEAGHIARSRRGGPSGRVIESGAAVQRSNGRNRQIDQNPHQPTAYATPNQIDAGTTWSFHRSPGPPRASIRTSVPRGSGLTAEIRMKAISPCASSDLGEHGDDHKERHADRRRGRPTSRRRASLIRADPPCAPSAHRGEARSHSMDRG